MQTCDVFSMKLHDTLAYTDGKNKMIWFRPSVGESCPCTSVQHGTTETVSTYLNAFVFFLPMSAVYASVKYGCSVTVALGFGHTASVFDRYLYRASTNP